MALSIINVGTITLQNSSTRSKIIVQDLTIDPPVNTDPYRLVVTLTDLGGSPKIYDVWPSPATRIVRTGVGQFYIDLGPADAELDGSHPIGSTILNVKLANPTNTSGWPATGRITINSGSLIETLDYSAVNIVSGSGTITLPSPTTKLYNSGILIVGPNTETNTIGEFIVNWQTELVAGGAVTNSIDKFKVISIRTASFLPEFKLLIDKSRKLTAPSSECFIGYTDGQLMSYLEGGLGTINAYQPSLTFTFENFPLDYKQILLDAGLVTGVMSQQLYAIDTDIPNYNDQGTSFVIVHQPQLASFLNQISQRLDRLIPMMKLQLLQPGSLHIQAGPNFRLTQLIQAAPSGSLFRNVFFKG